MVEDCLGCQMYKAGRDAARRKLAQSLTDEERLQIAQLRTEIRRMQIAAERRNRELDALHLVWCDGGCETGVHRFDEKGPEAITQEIVDAAVRNTERLKRWWINRQARQQREP
jgi:hypothetical protein